MYAWSVLAAPMAQELNVPSLSIVFSVANALGFISMIIGGLIADRKGPRWVMFVGGLMFGVGMFGCGFAQSVGHLILSYGVILGLGMSFVYGCTISTCIKFFPDKRGMAGGMATAFYGISSVIIAPIANVLNSSVESAPPSRFWARCSWWSSAWALCLSAPARLALCPPVISLPCRPAAKRLWTRPPARCCACPSFTLCW